MIEGINFLESAKELSQLGNETAFRNAISRAYYAAYHAVLPLDNAFANHGGVKSDVGVHEQLITKLENCPRSNPNWTELKSIGFLMRKAKTARTESDYDLTSFISEKNALCQIELVEKILIKISEVKKHLNNC